MQHAQPTKTNIADRHQCDPAKPGQRTYSLQPTQHWQLHCHMAPPTCCIWHSPPLLRGKRGNSLSSLPTTLHQVPTIPHKLPEVLASSRLGNVLCGRWPPIIVRRTSSRMHNAASECPNKRVATCKLPCHMENRRRGMGAQQKACQTSNQGSAA